MIVPTRSITLLLAMTLWLWRGTLATPSRTWLRRHLLSSVSDPIIGNTHHRLDEDTDNDDDDALGDENDDDQVDDDQVVADDDQVDEDEDDAVVVESVVEEMDDMEDEVAALEDEIEDLENGETEESVNEVQEIVQELDALQDEGKDMVGELQDIDPQDTTQTQEDLQDLMEEEAVLEERAKGLGKGVTSKPTSEPKDEQGIQEEKEALEEELTEVQHEVEEIKEEVKDLDGDDIGEALDLADELMDLEEEEAEMMEQAEELGDEKVVNQIEGLEHVEQGIEQNVEDVLVEEFDGDGEVLTSSNVETNDDNIISKTTESEVQEEFKPADDDPIALEEEEMVDLVEKELAKQEKVARRAGGFGIVLAIGAMIFTAHQMSENPDGFYASICRLAITITGVVVKIICMPCRKVIGSGNTHYAGHMPISTVDYNYRGNDSGFEMS